MSSIVLGKNSFFKDFMWVLFISVSLKMIFVRYSNRLVPWISSTCTKVPSERGYIHVSVDSLILFFRSWNGTFQGLCFYPVSVMMMMSIGWYTDDWPRVCYRYKNAADGKQALEKMNGFDLAGRQVMGTKGGERDRFTDLFFVDFSSRLVLSLKEQQQPIMAIWMMKVGYKRHLILGLWTHDVLQILQDYLSTLWLVLNWCINWQPVNRIWWKKSIVKQKNPPQHLLHRTYLFHTVYYFQHNLLMTISSARPNIPIKASRTIMLNNMFNPAE